MTVGLLGLLLTGGHAAIVQAADAWLIWHQFSAFHDDPGGGVYPWEIYDAQDNRASCVKALERIATEHVTNAKRNPDNRVTAEHYELSRIVVTEHQHDHVKGRYSSHYLCVPVGVDPNREKFDAFYLRKRLPQ